MTVAAAQGKAREFWTYTSTEAAGWANSMTLGIVNGLSRLGYRTAVLKIDGTYENLHNSYKSFLDRVKVNPNFVFLDINSRSGYDFSNGPTRFSFIVDSPVDHEQKLLDTEEDTIFGLIDRNHLPVLDAVMGKTCRKVFFPHAGPLPLPGLPSMADRPIDILYSGHVRANPGSPYWGERWETVPPHIVEIALEASRATIVELEGPYRALEIACQRHDFDPASLEPASFRSLVREVEMHAESTQRHRVLEKLTDMAVHVVGQPLDGGLLNLPKGTMRGELHFDDILELMKETKIVLNVTAKFAAGSHERIWYAMAHGCVVLTTYSHFMAEYFTHGKDILFIPPNLEDLQAMVSDLLNDVQKLDEIAANARAVYLANHTWHERVKIIDKVLNEDPLS